LAQAVTMFFLTCNWQTFGDHHEGTGATVTLDPGQADDPVEDECGDTIQVSITPGQVGDDSTVPVLVSIKPPQGTVRTPSDIIIVVDVSWSMTMEAVVQGADGKSESNGLSMLDIAKHAVRTIIRSLGAQDRLAIVSFCKKAAVECDLEFMDEGGRGRAEERLESLGFGGGTNLWAGIQAGLEVARAGRQAGRFAHMVVLIDGEAQDKDDVVPNLKLLSQGCEGKLPCTISTFGIGYEIDSTLLTEIADLCEGTYAFIPDASFVGTVFANVTANLLVTVARSASLSVELPAPMYEGGWSVPTANFNVLGGWRRDIIDGGKSCIKVGTVQCGQTKDIYALMDSGDLDKLKVTLTYDNAMGEAVTVHASMSPEVGDEALERHLRRSRFASALVESRKKAEVLKGVTQAGGVILEEKKKMSASPAAGREEVAALIEDICGQSSEAVSCQEYYRKWGRHYIPSVMFAHKLQQCNNFKDPGVQFYGGALFRALRDEADAEFSKLPAPMVTAPTHRYFGGGVIKKNPDYDPDAAPQRASVNMAAYNDRQAGCIDGASMARLLGGQRRQVSELAKGDRVAAADGATAEVVCAVRSRCPSGRARLVTLPGGARLTPHHPVRIAGAWCFPADWGEVEEVECEAVYSLVLRGAPDVIIGDTPCVALGHGLEEGAAKHPYFGSQRVLDDLAALPGFGAGLVDLPPDWACRDPVTGLVCGMLRGVEP